MAPQPPGDPAAPDEGMTLGEVLAILLAVGWIAVSAWYFFVMTKESSGTDPLRFVMMLLAVFLPVAVIWVALTAARSARIMREESRRLQAAIDGLRKSVIDERQARVKAEQAVTQSPAVEKHLSRLASATKATEEVLATFTSTRPRSAARGRGAPPPPEAEPPLPLGTPAVDAPPLAHADFIRALNFPENEEDDEGFSALRRVMRDRTARQLIQSSQDVLTLLSQDGIYMDDLHPDRARPEIWRRFAAGERGRAVADLGGIRDRSCLALTMGRMREDTVFRDAAHHFLRQFDKSLSAFETEATDEELALLGETRTARAFMLLGRVTGAFD